MCKPSWVTWVPKDRRALSGGTYCNFSYSKNSYSILVLVWKKKKWWFNRHPVLVSALYASTIRKGFCLHSNRECLKPTYKWEKKMMSQKKDDDVKKKKRRWCPWLASHTQLHNPAVRMHLLGKSAKNYNHSFFKIPWNCLSHGDCPQPKRLLTKIYFSILLADMEKIKLKCSKQRDKVRVSRNIVMEGSFYEHFYFNECIH